jgi:hypothetical protein
MIQMMMATRHGPLATLGTRRKQAFMLRKAVGFAIVTSGFALIVAHALQHALGG